MSAPRSENTTTMNDIYEALANYLEAIEMGLNSAIEKNEDLIIKTDNNNADEHLFQHLEFNNKEVTAETEKHSKKLSLLMTIKEVDLQEPLVDVYGKLLGELTLPLTQEKLNIFFNKFIKDFFAPLERNKKWQDLWKRILDDFRSDNSFKIDENEIKKHFAKLWLLKINNSWCKYIKETDSASFDAELELKQKLIKRFAAYDDAEKVLRSETKKIIEKKLKGEERSFTSLLSSKHKEAEILAEGRRILAEIKLDIHFQADSYAEPMLWRELISFFIEIDRDKNISSKETNKIKIALAKLIIEAMGTSTNPQLTFDTNYILLVIHNQIGEAFFKIYKNTHLDNSDKFIQDGIISSIIIYLQDVLTSFANRKRHDLNVLFANTNGARLFYDIFNSKATVQKTASDDLKWLVRINGNQNPSDNNNVFVKRFIELFNEWEPEFSVNGLDNFHNQFAANLFKLCSVHPDWKAFWNRVTDHLTDEEKLYWRNIIFNRLSWFLQSYAHFSEHTESKHKASILSEFCALAHDGIRLMEDELIRKLELALAKIFGSDDLDELINKVLYQQIQAREVKNNLIRKIQEARSDIHFYLLGKERADIYIYKYLTRILKQIDEAVLYADYKGPLGIGDVILAKGATLSIEEKKILKQDIAEVIIRDILIHYSQIETAPKYVMSILGVIEEQNSDLFRDKNFTETITIEVLQQCRATNSLPESVAQIVKMIQENAPFHEKHFVEAVIREILHSYKKDSVVPDYVISIVRAIQEQAPEVFKKSKNKLLKISAISTALNMVASPSSSTVSSPTASFHAMPGLDSNNNNSSSSYTSGKPPSENTSPTSSYQNLPEVNTKSSFKSLVSGLFRSPPPSKTASHSPSPNKGNSPTGSYHELPSGTPTRTLTRSPSPQTPDSSPTSSLNNNNANPPVALVAHRDLSALVQRTTRGAPVSNSEILEIETPSNTPDALSPNITRKSTTHTRLPPKPKDLETDSEENSLGTFIVHDDASRSSRETETLGTTSENHSQITNHQVSAEASADFTEAVSRIEVEKVRSTLDSTNNNDVLSEVAARLGKLDENDQPKIMKRASIRRADTIAHIPQSSSSSRKTSNATATPSSDQSTGRERGLSRTFSFPPLSTAQNREPDEDNNNSMTPSIHDEDNNNKNSVASDDKRSRFRKLREKLHLIKYKNLSGARDNNNNHIGNNSSMMFTLSGSEGKQELRKSLPVDHNSNKNINNNNSNARNSMNNNNSSNNNNNSSARNSMNRK